jgi:flagellar motor switch protein FliM
VAEQAMKDGADDALLSRDEISDILNVHFNSKDGLRSYISKLQSEAQEGSRLPMLDIVLDRYVRMLNTTMRNFTSENVDISIDNIYSQRFGDFINQIQGPVMLGMVRSAPWRNIALISIDSPLIYSVVDVLLGGRHQNDTAGLEGRTFTSIERRMILRMLEALLPDLNKAFATIGEPAFELDRLEVNPRFARVLRPDTPAVIAAMRFYMEDRGGKITMAFPVPLFQSVRERLGQQFIGDGSEDDKDWSSLLGQQTLTTRVNVQVILDTLTATLGDVLAWKPGQQIPLEATTRTPVEIHASKVMIGHGELGHSGGMLAVRML